MKKRFLESGVNLPQGWDYIMTDFVAGIFIGKVGAVRNKTNALLGAVFFKLRPCKFNNRADYVSPLFWDSAKAGNARSPCGIKNKSFRAIGKTVRGCDFCIYIKLCAAMLKKIIAEFSSRFLGAQMVLKSIFRHGCGKNLARNFKLFAHFPHKFFVAVAFRPTQIVVYMGAEDV